MNPNPVSSPPKKNLKLHWDLGLTPHAGKVSRRRGMMSPQEAEPEPQLSTSFADYLDRAINPQDTILGNRFLCRKGATVLSGPSGQGKSSWTVQAIPANSRREHRTARLPDLRPPHLLGAGYEIRESVSADGGDSNRGALSPFRDVRCLDQQRRRQHLHPRSPLSCWRRWRARTRS